MAGAGRMSYGSAGSYAPLFETKQAKGRLIYRVFAATVFASICMVWIYRVMLITTEPHHRSDDEHRTINMIIRSCGWMGMLGAELWFGFYWILSQALRWNRVYRCTFKDRLSRRYEQQLPRVDIFVCTADPVKETPIIVVNTVLSVMAYDYSPSKLSVYLSDDGGSELTFYALLEASTFSKFWLPYCRKYNVKPTSPMAYFRSAPTASADIHHAKDLNLIKKLYEEIEARITTTTKLGRVSEEARKRHKGFAVWNSSSTVSKQDHDTILQILIDGRNPDAVDEQGSRLPGLVYLAREKRPQHFHNFKAGAMNALIRVSSVISNAPIILNVDCDMYSNNVQSVRDAVCFFMDEKHGQDIAYVQFPQKFENATKNDIYGSTMRTSFDVELPGLDGYGGPCYIGTGCLHRRDVLCGRKLHDLSGVDWMKTTLLQKEPTLTNKEEELKMMSGTELERKAIPLASSTYELDNSQWGKAMGLKYGCSVEDILTGLTIQCRGWKSVYFKPEVAGFLGLAPTTLFQTLVQHRRWSEGHLQISISNNCPLWLGRHGSIPFGLQLGYLYFGLWAPNCFATLAYSTIPSLFLLKAIPLFPKVSSPWFLPFAYVVVTSYATSLAEFLLSGGTTLGWWNEQRIWLYKRTSSYLFASIDCVAMLLGLSKPKFSVTLKVAEKDVEERYAREKIEFGVTSPMFTILATLALVNLFSLAVVLVKGIIMSVGFGIVRLEIIESMASQILLCVALVAINLPLYEALFLRKDTGKIPSSVAARASALALVLCVCFLEWS